MKVTIIKDGKVINNELEINIDELIEHEEFEEDMNYFDKMSEQSYAMYAGLIAVNYFLQTGEELIEESESFTEKDFEYGVKILNACMERKAKEIGGNYTLVIKPLEKEEKHERSRIYKRTFRPYESSRIL